VTAVVRDAAARKRWRRRSENAIVKTKVGIDRIDIVAVVDPIVFLVGVMPAL